MLEWLGKFHRRRVRGIRKHFLNPLQLKLPMSAIQWYVSFGNIGRLLQQLGPQYQYMWEQREHAMQVCIGRRASQNVGLGQVPELLQDLLWRKGSWLLFQGLHWVVEIVQHPGKKDQTCLRKHVKERGFPYIGETCEKMWDWENKKWISQNKPTMPILRLLPGRPRRIFFSGGAAFFGGILFFAARVADVEDKRNAIVYRWSCWWMPWLIIELKGKNVVTNRCKYKRLHKLVSSVELASK